VSPTRASTAVSYNNLNQLARWANTHASVMEAVRVTDRLMAVERSLRALALPAGEDG